MRLQLFLKPVQCALLIALFFIPTLFPTAGRGQGGEKGLRYAVGPKAIEGGSLALVYEYAALEKPGDFNKHYIRALVILEEGEPVGIKIAGHSEESICRQTTEIVIQLAKDLDGKRANFGTIDSEEGYFASYGIFDGPVNDKYRKPYETAYESLKALEASAPGKLEVRTMMLSEYQRIHQEILKHEQASEPQVYIHYLPEPFILYRPTNSFAPEQFAQLRQKVKNEVTRDYIQRVKAEQQNLQALIDIVNKVELPMQFRPYPNPMGIVENTPQRMQRYRAICADALKKPDNRRRMLDNNKLLKQYQLEHNKLQNPYLKEFSQLVLDFIEGLLVEDELCIKLKESLIEMEEDQKFQADSVSLEWQAADLNNFAQTLERALVNKKTFVLFSEGFGERHYDLLTDATIRGWPALDPRQFKALYTSGHAVRKEARAISQYHYIAPNNGQPQVGASVSGVMFQVVGQGQPQYYALQDFMYTENEVPDVMVVARRLASSGQIPQKNIKLVQYRNGKPSVTEAPNTLMLSAIEKNFVLLPANQQLDTLRAKTGLPITPLQPGIASGNSFTVVGQGNLYLHQHSPFAVYAGDLLRHATRRATLDPKLDGKLGFNPVHVPVNAPVVVTGNSWYEFKFAQLPQGASTLIASAQASPDQRAKLSNNYARLMLQLPLELRDLPSASPINTFANSFVGLFDGFIKHAQAKFGENADQWTRDQQDYVSFARDLLNGLYERRKDQVTLVAHNPDPLRVFIAGGEAYLTDFQHDSEQHYAGHLAQVFAHMALVRYTDAKPLTESQLKPLFSELITLAKELDYIPDKALQNDDFQSGLAMGMFDLLPYFAKQRMGYDAESAEVKALATRIQNVYQPALIFLLKQAGEQPLSEGTSFLMRNLGLVLETLAKGGFVYAG